MARSLHMAGAVPKSHPTRMLPPTGVPTALPKQRKPRRAPARGDQGRGNNRRKLRTALPSPGVTRSPALSPAVGPILRSRIKDTKQDPLPRAVRHCAHPRSPPRGEGAPTLDTVMGFPKSLPPVMRNPQGAGPAKVTVTGMAAGGSGWAGSGGVGKFRGALRSSGRHSPAAPPSPAPRGSQTRGDRDRQRLPSGEGTHVPALSQGAGSHRRFLLPPCCPQLGLVASSPAENPRGTRGDPLWCSRWDGAGEVTPLSPGPCARQEIGATLAVCGTAGPSQRGLEGTMRLRGQPAASGGRILLLTAAGGLQAPAPRVLRPTADRHRERMLTVPQGGTGSPRHPSKRRGIRGNGQPP